MKMKTTKNQTCPVSPESRTRLRKFENMAFFVLLFVLAPMLLEMGYIRIMPSSHWVQYDEIAPLKPKFPIGEDLFFISSAEIKQLVNIEWEDVLYCDLSNDTKQRFVYYSVYTSSKKQVHPMKWTGDEAEQWAYRGEIPKVPAKCYLDSTTTAVLDYGFKKSSNIKSPVFEVLEEK